LASRISFRFFSSRAYFFLLSCPFSCLLPQALSMHPPFCFLRELFLPSFLSVPPRFPLVKQGNLQPDRLFSRPFPALSSARFWPFLLWRRPAFPSSINPLPPSVLARENDPRIQLERFLALFFYVALAKPNFCSPFAVPDCSFPFISPCTNKQVPFFSLSFVRSLLP